MRRGRGRAGEGKGRESAVQRIPRHCPRSRRKLAIVVKADPWPRLPLQKQRVVVGPLPPTQLPLPSPPTKRNPSRVAARRCSSPARGTGRRTTCICVSRSCRRWRCRGSCGVRCGPRPVGGWAWLSVLPKRPRCPWDLWESAPPPGGSGGLILSTLLGRQQGHRGDHPGLRASPCLGPKEVPLCDSGETQK